MDIGYGSCTLYYFDTALSRNLCICSTNNCTATYATCQASVNQALSSPPPLLPVITPILSNIITCQDTYATYSALHNITPPMYLGCYFMLPAVDVFDMYTDNGTKCYAYTSNHTVMCTISIDPIQGVLEQVALIEANYELWMNATIMAGANLMNDGYTYYQYQTATSIVTIGTNGSNESTWALCLCTTDNCNIDIATCTNGMNIPSYLLSYNGSTSTSQGTTVSSSSTTRLTSSSSSSSPTITGSSTAVSTTTSGSSIGSTNTAPTNKPSSSSIDVEQRQVAKERLENNAEDVHNRWTSKRIWLTTAMKNVTQFQQDIDNIKLTSRQQQQQLIDVTYDRSQTIFIHSRYLLSGMGIKEFFQRDNTKQTNNDDNTLIALGYKPELKREFQYLSAFGQAWGSQGLAPSIAGSLIFALGSGGSVASVWTWIVGCFFLIPVALSLGELGSSMPTSGGVYYWVAKLTPITYRPLLCWFSAYMITLGYITLITRLILDD
ncbi:unnamed protein product [Adineta steineri]|uniref:Uncharacterized protein n=2 Tax=Adineta steineri TaxID=433720 RepID=A0A814FL53_9BILA|nr:unnamed protein product [Adineta steineri]